MAPCYIYARTIFNRILQLYQNETGDTAVRTLALLGNSNTVYCVGDQDEVEEISLPEPRLRPALRELLDLRRGASAIFQETNINYQT